MSHKRFSHIGLSTLDLDKTRAFYEGVLGFEAVVAETKRVEEGGRIRQYAVRGTRRCRTAAGEFDLATKAFGLAGGLRLPSHGYPQLRGHGPIRLGPVEQIAFIDSWTSRSRSIRTSNCIRSLGLWV
jgi:catechol 2,3-dioxygenase-like lactoylglutathione lyase family enzyme